MAFVAVDKNGEEWVYQEKPNRMECSFDSSYMMIELPKGTIKKLIGFDLKWEDDPVELT